MLERYADIGSIRRAAAEAAAEWQGLALLARGEIDDPHTVARLGATLMQARINATGILVCEIAKALAAQVQREALKPALRIVTFELDRLSHGQIHPSLYMAEVAAELAAACQSVARPAGAFFLPIIPLLPALGGTENSPEIFAEAVEVHLPDYESALIAFARNGDVTALHTMQRALIAIENRNPVAEYRIVISLATAFISALEDGIVSLDSEGRHLFSRIDVVLRSAAKNAPIPDPCIASRLAFVLAQAPATHKRSAHLQARLGLKALVSYDAPNISEFPPSDIFDTVFQAMVDEFENYLGDRNDGLPMVKAADQLRTVCSINSDAMRLAGALHGLLNGLCTKRLKRSPEIVDHLSQLMARMLDTICAHDAPQLKTTAEEEVEAATRILKDGSLSMMLRDATSLYMGDYFREAAIDARAAFSLVNDPEGDLEVAVTRACEQLEMIEAVLKICHENEGAATVRCILEKLGDQKAEAKRYLPALDALVRYLDSVGGDPEAAQALLADIRGKHLKARSKALDEDSPCDQEIFDIFLGEAREMVAAIRGAVGQGEAVIVSKDILIATRRNFHTLKGSARITGLSHLGEAMFNAETVFNSWLGESPPYPIELSRFADQAAGFALAACEAIARQGYCEVDESALREDGEALLAMLDQIAPAPEESEQTVRQVAGEESTELAPMASSTPASEPAISPVPQDLPAAECDSTTEASAEDEFDPELLALYFVESAEMLATLREQTLAARHTLVSFELIRAAHGLAGMSRTVGLPEIARMALPIEDWAMRLSELRHRPPEKDIDTVRSAADQIERCIQAIKSGRRCVPDLTIVAGLASERSSGAAEQTTAPDALVADQVEAPSSPLQAPEIVLDFALDIEVDQTPDQALDISMDFAPEAVSDPIPEPPPAQSTATTATAVPVPETERPDEIDPLVLNEFSEEASDLLQALDDELVLPSPSIPQINRFLHTFKGGARLCGAMHLGDLLHRLESLTAHALNADQTKEVLAEVDRGLDEARMMLSVLLTPEGEAATVAVTGEAEASDEASAADGPTLPILEAAEENVVFRVTSGQVSELTGQLDDMRVARDMLAQQLADAGEAAESIVHPVRRIEELATLIQIEAETQIDAGAKSADARFDALEFDRFTAMHELTRKLSEAVQDVLAFSDGMSGSLARADRALIQSRSAASAFALRLAGISRGPLDILEPRLKGAVRSAAVTLGKDCYVELPPSKVRIERAVLDRVAPALDHLVRNSVAHGIESVEQRLASGKPAAGCITIRARQRGEMAEIVVADDGGGINIEAVRRKVKERGLEKRYSDEDKLLEALFDAGFSTAETLTQVAGRGVGLDVVRDIITNLGGRVRIENRPGLGASFVLTIPISAAFVSGLMLTIGHGVYVLPGASVVELAVLTGAAVREALETGLPAMVNGRPTQLVWLGALVNADSRPVIHSHNKIVLVDSGRTGLIADDVQYIDALLTKPFPQAAAWGGSILGCAILHDGRTALIIDPARTLALMANDPTQTLASDNVEKEEPLVLVVDDSITVRKVTSRLILRHGFRVETAENGKVALEKLQEMEGRLPTAILMDIEMPVMDGFEATRQIKSNPLTSGIPVIIISSRNVEKHIDYAKSMGADHFLGKPYKEDLLVTLLQQYAADGNATAALPASL